jgi:hypothetical protein
MSLWLWLISSRNVTLLKPSVNRQEHEQAIQANAGYIVQLTG